MLVLPPYPPLYALPAPWMMPPWLPPFHVGERWDCGLRSGAGLEVFVRFRRGAGLEVFMRLGAPGVPTRDGAALFMRDGTSL